MPFTALVIGASSAIAQAVVKRLENDPDCVRIFAVSQRPVCFSSNKVTPFLCDYSEPSIAEICLLIMPLAENISRVVICNGVLHSQQPHQTWQPEKKLEDVTTQQLTQSFHSNSIVPMLWLSRLLPLLKDSNEVKMAVFSARVASISDNKLGGWYSYRASKAALNMLLQTSAIEYARRAPQVKLIAFHPGTTDTELSKPFQKNVTAEKLFTPEFVAKRLLFVLDNAAIDQKAAYLDWNNTQIDW